MFPTLSDGSTAQRPFLNVEKLIKLSYVVLVALLSASVYLSIRIREEGSWKRSPEFALYEEHDRQLAEIRKHVLQGTTSTRDYLINNHLNSAEVYDEETRRAKAGATKAFLALSSWTQQRSALTQIDRDLAGYWTLIDQHRLATLKEKEEQGYDLLHQRILPARDEVLDGVKALEDLVTEERTQLATRFAQERNADLTAIFVLMGVTIALSLLLASGNQKFRYDLQVESRRKFEEIASARDSLEQLSGRLLRIQEEERRKISRELHDGIGQTLTALRMEIHQVHFSATGHLTGGEERLLRARRLAEEAVQTVKDISLLLRPPLLDDLGLEPALAWLGDQFMRRTEIECRFRAVNLQEHLPDDLKTCIFRVIQEALNNCEKHASPTCVDIFVEQRAETILISVQDDGAGFLLKENNTPARNAGLGILGMRERAVLLGGKLVIDSAPGLGTKLNMSLPIARLGLLNLAATPPQALIR